MVVNITNKYAYILIFVNKMSTDLLIFSLFYLLVAFGIIYPPTEFVSAGFTIPAIFAKYLKSENEHFIQHHIHRTSLNLFIHSVLPVGYFLLLVILYGPAEAFLFLDNANHYVIQTYYAFSIVLPCLALYKINSWFRGGWENHPICKNLLKFCNNDTNWIAIAADISVEFRRIDKICIRTNTLTTIVATDNWLLKVTPYNMYCAHQSDTALIVCSSDSHHCSMANRNQVQFINIEVKSTRASVAPFFIRLNALDFKDLQDRWARPIVVLPNVVFQVTLLDRFVDAFKEQIKLNQIYETNQELDPCIGCTQVQSNIKLQKLCLDDTVDQLNDNQCVNCYCRPMWCADCMAKWFASRQKQEESDVWLTLKCTCPLCRANFCIYDVSFVQFKET